MTNNIIALDFNGVKIILDGDTKLVMLTIPDTTGVTTSFHNSADNTNYQVPSGKKATIIFIEAWKTTTASIKISFADNADGDTNAVELFVPATTNLISNLMLFKNKSEHMKFEYKNGNKFINKHNQ